MRFNFLLPILASLSTLVSAQDTNPKTVKEVFEKYSIPKDLQLTFSPTALLHVYFTGGVTKVPTTFSSGDILPRNATVGPVKFEVINPVFVPTQARYVIIAVDPDAPTPQNPTNAQIRHFLGGNYVYNPITPGPWPYLVNTTAAITEYRQPNPPAISDYHRYIFLLYNQPAGFDDQKVVTPETPISLWNVAKFAKEVGLGDPIGGTFMRVRSDLWVGPVRT